MFVNVFFYDYGLNEGRYSDWSVWYYLDGDNYPHAITYKIVPRDDIQTISAGDGWLNVNMKDRNESFVCYGNMMFDSEFAKQYSFLDRKCIDWQSRIKTMYERENDAAEAIFEISNRFTSKMKNLLQSAYSYSFDKNYVNTVFATVREELCALPFVPYFEIKEGNVTNYHPICDIDIASLQPNIDVHLSDNNVLALNLDKDARTLLMLLRLDMESFFDYLNL